MGDKTEALSSSLLSFINPPLTYADRSVHTELHKNHLITALAKSVGSAAVGNGITASTLYWNGHNLTVSCSGSIRAKNTKWCCVLRISPTAGSFIFEVPIIVHNALNRLSLDPTQGLNGWVCMGHGNEYIAINITPSLNSLYSALQSADGAQLLDLPLKIDLAAQSHLVRTTGFHPLADAKVRLQLSENEVAIATRRWAMLFNVFESFRSDMYDGKKAPRLAAAEFVRIIQAFLLQPMTPPYPVEYQITGQ